MNFEHFQFLVNNTFPQEANGQTGALPQKFSEVTPSRMHPLVLAYVGDAFFTLYVRTRLLSYEQNKVRVLHTFDAKMVSATMQAYAYKALAADLTEEEREIVRRGRNTKSTAPKSATVAEYRYSTGFEALLGHLYLEKKYERASEIAEKAFIIISRKLTQTDKN